MIRDVDKDGSGAIDVEEFVTMMTTKIGERDTEEELMKSFHIIDHDRNGKISMEDIQRVSKQTGEPFTYNEIMEMIEATDDDSDGQINPNEFPSIMRNTTFGL